MDQERFLKFDDANPEIWVKFERISLDLIRRGRVHYGAKAICEVIRYQTLITGQQPTTKVVGMR